MTIGFGLVVDGLLSDLVEDSLRELLEVSDPLLLEYEWLALCPDILIFVFVGKILFFFEFLIVTIWIGELNCLQQSGLSL